MLGRVIAKVRDDAGIVVVGEEDGVPAMDIEAGVEPIVDGLELGAVSRASHASLRDQDARCRRRRSC